MNSIPPELVMRFEIPYSLTRHWVALDERGIYDIYTSLFNLVLTYGDHMSSITSDEYELTQALLVFIYETSSYYDPNIKMKELPIIAENWLAVIGNIARQIKNQGIPLIDIGWYEVSDKSDLHTIEVMMSYSGPISSYRGTH